MIGGERQHDRLAIAQLRKGRARHDRRAGIAPHRLEQHVGLEPDFRQLFQHHETIRALVITIGRSNSAHPTPEQRVLKRRTRSEQRQELLGADFARSRP